MCKFNWLIGILSLTALAHSATVSDTIYQRIDSTLLTATVSKTNVTSYLATQLADGSWADINYADKGQSVWDPVKHTQRLQSIALGWAQVGSPWYHQDSVLTHLKKGFNIYLQKAPVSTNWWFNEIGAALPWGQALMMVKGAVDDTILARWALYINGTWSKWTGANLTDEGTAHIYRCIATKQPTGIDSVVKAIRAAVQIVDSGDGLHADYSFAQHTGSTTHFIYSGGYGETFLSEEISWWQLVAGTSFAYPQTQTNLLEKMTLDGSAWMVHGGRWDPSVIGRGIARPGTHSASAIAGNATNLLLGSSRTGDLNSVASWINGKSPWPFTTSPDRYFWSCQYLTHHANGWMISLRSARKGVIGMESINGENLKGWFLPFGATWIHVRGTEHDQIWPSLDWARIPGVTADRIDTFPASANNKGWGNVNGTTTFVGGASDGQGASIAYDYSLSGILAKKAWFQTPDALIALGSGLSFTKAKTVNTSVDQRLARGIVTIGSSDGSRATLLADSLRKGNAQWIHHDSVGYWFPTPETLMVAAHTQSGSWKTIDTAYADTQVVQNIFSIWIDHGTTMSQGSYAYAVVPGISADSMANWVKASRVSIAANKPTAQAISENGWRGVVFHAADSVHFADGLSVKANIPCAAVLRDSSAGIFVTVADPAQTSASVTLQISNAASTKIVTLTFPAAPLAGSSVSQWVPIATTSIRNVPQGSRVSAQTPSVRIFDLLGHQVAQGEGALQQLPHGTWIIVRTNDLQRNTELKIVP